MNPESWIALATVVASTITTVVGLRLAARERTSAFRQVLYSRQFEVGVGILDAYAKVRSAMTLLFAAQDDISRQDTIWHEVRRDVDAFAVLAPGALAALPSGAYTSFAALHARIRDVMNRIAYNPLAEAELGVLDAAALSFAADLRGLLGTDGLSRQNKDDFANNGSRRNDLAHLPTRMRDVADPLVK